MNGYQDEYEKVLDLPFDECRFCPKRKSTPWGIYRSCYYFFGSQGSQIGKDIHPHCLIHEHLSGPFFGMVCGHHLRDDIFLPSIHLV